MVYIAEEGTGIETTYLLYMYLSLVLPRYYY